MDGIMSDKLIFVHCILFYLIINVTLEVTTDYYNHINRNTYIFKQITLLS